MTSIKFIHASDLHLDTPFKGLSLSNPELAARQKDATLKSFRRIIDLCIEREVDFLIIAGDVYDSDNQSVASQTRFAGELRRLGRHNIPVYLVCGNHDPLSSWLKENKLPENVFRFCSDEVEKFTYSKNGVPVANIYGTSFEQKVVRDNLARKYERCDDPAPISIAVLHGTIGAQAKHEPYAPFVLDDIKTKQFDYWALGHIHKRQILHPAHPAVVYPGNPQGRDFGETGAKGCYVVEIAAGSEPRLEFVPTQSIRFEEIDLDLTGEDTFSALEPQAIFDRLTSAIEEYAPDCSYICRVTLTGRTPLHARLKNHGELEKIADDFNSEFFNGGSFWWIGRITLHTSPEINFDEIRRRDDFPAGILKIFDTYEAKPETRFDLFKQIADEFRHGNAQRYLGGLSATDHENILQKAKLNLFDHLIQEPK